MSFAVLPSAFSHFDDDVKISVGKWRWRSERGYFLCASRDDYDYDWLPLCCLRFELNVTTSRAWMDRFNDPVLWNPAIKSFGETCTWSYGWLHLLHYDWMKSYRCLILGNSELFKSSVGLISFFHVLWCVLDYSWYSFFLTESLRKLSISKL